MKIAIWHDLPSGGGKRALYDQVRGLLERGHSVESWCTSTADQDFLPLGDLCPEHIVPLAINPKSWAARAGRISLGATERLAFLKSMDEHCQRCAAQIDKGGFDVVLAGSSGPLAVTSLATHLTTPSALYLGEPCRPLYEAPTPWPAPTPGLPRDPRALYRRLMNPIQLRAFRRQASEELRGVKAYTRVLTNSLFSRESIIRAYGLEPMISYLGVDTRRYTDLNLPRQRSVIGIGTFYPHKRVEVVIEAVARVQNSGGRRIKLTWIGNSASDTYLADLVGLARRRGVEFEPCRGASHDEVVKRLNEAGALAYAPRLEPFGYAPLEAAACCLPVVAKAEGGVRETVLDGETGFLVQEDSDLARAISDLLDNQDLQERMGKAGRAWVESRWSLAKASERLESHLAEIARTPR